MSRATVLLALVSTLALALPASRAQAVMSDEQVANAIRLHVISFDLRGDPVDPQESLRGWSQRRARMTRAEYESHVDAILANVGAGDAKIKEIMIFIHGGLNDLRQTHRRLQATLAPMNDVGIYPIFITWPAAGLSSYMHEVTRSDSGLINPLSVYSKPVLDLATGILRAPVHLLSREIPLGALAPGFRWDDEAAASLTRASLAPTPVEREARLPHVSMANEQAAMPRWWSWRHGPLRYLAFPLKVPAIGFVDVLGARAWLGMKTSLSGVLELSETEDVLRRQKSDRPPVLLLLEKLSKRARSPDGLPTTTLVAHSMGTIIANRILNFANQRATHDDGHGANVPEFERIVYMGAACDIREVEDVVYPYLATNRQTHFYNLVLHPLNERTENAFFDLLPRGSLLVWIDDFYEASESRKARTAGRWTNYMSQAYDIPWSVADRVRVRVFPVFSDGDTPTDHGGFTKVPFWTPQFRGD